KTYALRQVPNVEGGVVIMDTQTGRVLAMSGGWSYGRSQFNRAVQAARQPGSAFKPFVYVAAMDAGLTPATIVLDGPFSSSPGYDQAGPDPAAPDIVDPRKPFPDPASVYQVVSMMQGVTTRGTAGRLAALGRPIAGKTGTTNDSRDNWFLGSTPDITVGIYM